MRTMQRIGQSHDFISVRLNRIGATCVHGAMGRLHIVTGGGWPAGTCHDTVRTIGIGQTHRHSGTPLSMSASVVPTSYKYNSSRPYLNLDVL